MRYGIIAALLFFLFVGYSSNLEGKQKFEIELGPEKSKVLEASISAFDQYFVEHFDSTNPLFKLKLAVSYCRFIQLIIIQKKFILNKN